MVKASDIADSSREPTVPQGAYGLILAGLQSTVLVSPVPSSWPRVQIERRVPSDDSPQRSQESPDATEIAYPNGWGLRVERNPRRVVFFVPSAVDGNDLVHPFLAPAAVRLAGWLGRPALHGGAFVTDRGAWGVLAPRTGGKSTTLAHLAGSGVPVLSDDILVVENGGAYAGPRLIDLRPEDWLDPHERTVAARGGDRQRLALPEIEATAPLRGFFFLEWGDTLELETLPPSRRLALLNDHCRPEATSPVGLLELARLPAWRLRRPQDRAALDDVCLCLLEATLKGVEPGPL
jgi:hypothetical protein